VTDTCAGACCAVFPMKKGFKATGKEGRFIADMRIPLTRRQALRRSRRLGYSDPPRYGKKWEWFTCRHWDEQTRLCTVYDKRPKMCRDYPYSGRQCERGCGYSLPQKDEDRIAQEKDSTWVWDVAAKGWRPRSSTGFLWDADKGLLRRIPKAAA
jgi:Fe-S-cluster containining protein